MLCIFDILFFRFNIITMNLASFKKSTKIIGLVLLVVVLLMAALFLSRGAQNLNLFSRASSCDASNVSAAQVSANSAVIAWTSNDVSTGRVEYGTNSTSLNLQAPEGSAGKTHNIPLTLLTPNTVYYYLVAIGDNKCDSSGQSCSGDTCVPWSFTTAAITPQQQIVAPILSPTPASVSATPVASTSAVPTSAVSAFCREVQANIGANSTDATKWAILKQYDIDSSGFINGMDAMKCPATGK